MKNTFPIVGIGASAGGLKAFTQLLEAIPPDIGMAFVLVQHLDPTSKSLLSETLARTTPLPLVEITDGTKITKNHIYAMPSESYVTITDSTLHLTPRKKRAGLQKPIDSFFQSLAKHHGKDAIGIVLSGTGSDGTDGIKAIKESGGRTFAQDDSAAFKDMPRNAVDSGSVDFILSPDGIAKALIKIGRETTSSNVTSKTKEDQSTDEILALLYTSHGMDFRHYKTTSVNRRIQRRMLLNHIKTVKQYASFLTKHPAEVEALQKDMLIHVTNFFRDPEQFEVLKQSVFPRLFKDRSPKKPITIWIAGCATGEEAYSLAIALQGYRENKTKRPNIRILGTDIAKDAIAIAMKGVYAETITEQVSKVQIRRFFTKVKGGYKVKKAIRGLCEFAVADVTKKPLRNNFDLVSCRNVLIYLGEALQQQALIMLSAALKPGGFLLLGKSESLGESATLFSVVDKKQRVYSKKTVLPVTSELRKTVNEQVGMDTPETVTPKPKTDNQEGYQQKISKLRDAMLLTREYADEIIAELDVMTEELQSTNEELTASNEELQTANEELETTQEELQTANEEMITLNEELLTKNEKVAFALDYTEAIIKTVRIPLVVLDAKLKVKTANKSFYKFFKVTPKQTEKRRFSELGNRQWDSPRLKKLLEAVLLKKKSLEDFEVVHTFEIIGQKRMLLNARMLQQELESKPLILVAIEDVTEKKHFEELLRDFFMQAPALIAILRGREGKCQLVNELFSKLFSERDVIGKPMREAWPEVEGQGWFEIIERVYETGTPLTGNEKLAVADWNNDGIFFEKFFNYIFALYLAADGRVEGVMIFGFEVTEQIRAREKVAESEERYRRLVESTNIIPWAADGQTGNFTYIGPQAKDLFGYSVKQWYQKDFWSQHIHPEDREWAVNYCLVSLATKEEYEFDYRMFKKNGQIVWLHDVVSVIKKADGEKILTGFLVDITERKKGEERVKQSEEQFRTLANNISQFAWMTDENGSVFWYNKRWFDYTGTTLKEMQGWGWQKVHHPDHVKRVVEKVSHSFKTGEIWEDTFPLRGKDGAYRWFLSRAIPIRDKKGKILHWFGTNTDITEQRELEQQKDEFIGIASHELKTPVTSVKAYTQVLQTRFRKANDIKSFEMVTKMDAQLDKLTSLIVDLLDVTKIEAGRIQFHEGYFDFNELAQEVVEELQRTTEGHRIVTELAPSRTVYGDRDRVGQVITNFMTNAIKYSPHADNIIVKTLVDKENVTLYVRDFGVGIAKEDQAKVFERFYRVGGSSQTTYPGLGLGLYISSEIIKRQNGRVWVESTKGKGSTFCFSLPIQKQKIQK